jgi:hypothetical protein
VRVRLVRATAIFTLLALVNSLPLITDLSGLIGAHGDSYFSVWRLAWVAHKLPTDPLHLFDANIFYPHPATLAYSDAMLLPGAVLAPLHWLHVSPIAVYNLALLGAFVASGVAACLLVTELTGSFAAGLLGGVIFGFSPHRFEHFDHLELQFAFWIPLAVLAWHRALSRERGYFIVGLLVTGQVLSCIYHGMFLLLWLGVLTVVRLYRMPRRAVHATVKMLVIPLIVLAVYSVPYMRSRADVGERNPSEIAGYSAVPSDFLSAPSNNRFYGWTDFLGANERHLFPGFVALALLVVGFWPPLDRTRMLHAVGLALAVDLTLGFNGGLYQFLYAWVLPFRGLRVPARADILVLLGTAVIAGFGLTRITRTIRRPQLATAVSVVLIAAASVECLASPRLIPVPKDISVWYASLRTRPNTVIFEWPVTVPWRLYKMLDVEYMYRSTRHWQPLINGYSGKYPNSYIELLYDMRSFPDTKTIAELKRRGVTVLVLHEEQGTRPSYTYAVERLVRDPSIKVIAEDWEDGHRVAFFELLPNAVKAD